MEKNLYRLAGVVIGVVVGWSLAGPFIGAPIGAFIGLIAQALFVVFFVPGVNVRHKVKLILRAAEGSEIYVLPWTKSRLYYFMRQYGLALKGKPVELSVDMDNGIILKKVAEDL